MKLPNPLSWIYCAKKDEGNDAPQEVSTLQRLFPQFTCSFAVYLMCLDLGLSLAIPTIIIPSLIGVNKNPDETIVSTSSQASWIASIGFIIQPIGNVLSGFLCDAFGKKRTIVLINIIPIIAWVMLAYARTIWLAYLATAVLGFAIGLTSSPTNYIGEICEPSIRGVLLAGAGIATTIGIFLVYLLGAILTWRQVALICGIVPAVNILVAVFIPETPIWLLSKKRTEEAQKTLKWLRGGVAQEMISSELNQLKQILELTQSCPECSSNNCEHKSTSKWGKIVDLTQQRTIKPFVLVVLLFLIMQFTGMMVMRPYYVQILEAYGVTVPANLLISIFGVMGILANICIMLTIRVLGKRRIYLYSMIINCICSFGMSLYGFYLLPNGWVSTTAASSIKLAAESVGNYGHIAVAMFLIMHFCVSVGISSIPYFMLGEVFPFKTRAFYCGVCSALSQVFGFVATKTYYDLEHALTLPGIMSFYGILGLFGIIIMFFIMPETEHRSLEDIELHYSDNARSITDINISISAKTSLADDINKC